MCGIAGIIKTSQFVGYNLKNEYRSTVQDLLYSTALRGKHSTGVFLVPWDKTKPTTIIKRAIQASEFLFDDKYKQNVADFSDIRFYIGHTRYATTGGVSTENAHPFNHDNIVLVHNGSITNKNDLLSMNNSNPKNCDVDSESIAIALSNNSVEDVIPKIEGAFSLVWYDTEEKSLNFIRNTKRPMNFAVIKGEGEPILFASEPEAIQFICSRDDVQIERWLNLKVGHLFTVKDDGQFSFREIYDGKPIERTYNYTYSWNRRYSNSNYSVGTVNLPSTKTKEQNFLGFTKGQQIQFSYSEFKPYKKKTNNEQYGCLVGIMDSQPYHTVHVHRYREADLLKLNTNDLIFTGEFSSVSRSKEQYVWGTYVDDSEEYIININPNSVIAFEDKSDDEQILDTAVMCWGPNGELVTVEKFEKLVEDGCCYCAAPINHDESEAIGWTADGRPLCKTCCSSWVGDTIGSNQIYDYPINKK